ncbi:MAG: hypothetical protein JWL71_3312 [Acidobacteria bacterium]|nr:hypothetical protein [Acidobacteriota bacterium]
MSLPVVRRLAVSVTGAALLAAAGSMLHAQAVPVSNPPAAPRSILVFPQRDFVSSSGFEIGDLVTVEVFHPGATTPASTASNVVPQDDPATPAFDGIVEVNHPGGVCWETITPDIRAGDRVRTTRRDAFGTILGIDETTIANVKAKRPVELDFSTVAIHGSAQNADGTPIDITQLEQRLVANRDAFDVNGRRTLRASSVPGANDGILSYDPVDTTNPRGINWTAVYTGLDPADVTRALNAESRGMWLGTNPGALVESTIFEIGAAIFPGPTAGCAAPLEKLPPLPGSELIPPTQPTNVTAAVTGSNTVSLNWSPSTDNIGVTSYGVYRNGVAIANVQNTDGSAPAPVFYEDFNVPAGTYTYTVDAADEVGNRSAQAGTTPAQVTTKVQTADPLPLCTDTPNGSCVSEPPAATPTQVQIIAFPARDFTSSSGYTLQDATVTVQVIRNGLLITTANVIPVDDPTTVGFDGTVEVNHPGGGCWQGLTPDIRAGDVIRQIAYASDGATVRRVDQIHVSNMSVERPRIVHAATPGLNDGVIEVHGTAIDTDGNPIPAANVEQRLVATRDRYDLNGRRTIRAGGAGKDGDFSYDAVNNPTGMKFTATYRGLDEDDVFRAVGGTTSAGRVFGGADSRVIYLGDPTAIAPMMTIYENTDLTISGPAAGACTAAIEALDTQAPSTPAPVAAQSGPNSVTLTWSPSSDDTYVNGYGIYRRDDDVAGAAFVRIRNVGAPALPAGLTTYSFTDASVPVGNHTYAVDAVDSASPLKVNYPNAFAGPNEADPILQGVEWGNRSVPGAANPLSQRDVLPPSVPSNLVAKVIVGTTASDQVSLTWTASTDNVGVRNYRVYRTEVATGIVTAFDVNGAPPDAKFVDTIPAAAKAATVSYSYSVDAADATPNRSARSSSVTVLVQQRADTGAPSIGGALTANTRDVYVGTAPAIGAHDVRLSWTAATDNVGIASYGIYRRAAASLTAPAAAPAFVKVADVNGTTLTYTDVNLATGTYDYAVDAADSTGNRSDATRRPIALEVQTVDDPPQGKHSILSFPQRDFVSSTGYAVGEGPVIVTVIRNGKLWARSTPVSIVEDPATPGLGAVDVNHPGGGCWDTAKLNGLDGITPDLRAGDIIRFTNKAGVSDQTTSANVYADRPTDRSPDGTPLAPRTIQVHGTAQDASGNPLPVAQVESRLVSSSADPFANGRRTLRSTTDGRLVYDAVSAANPKGTNWTATFAELTPSDVDLAMASESRGVWLGRTPATLNELTFFENGDGIVGGPAGGTCTAPAEAGAAVAFQEAAPFVASFDPGAQTLAFPSLNTGTSTTQTLTLTNVGSADAARSITGTLAITGAGIDVAGDFVVAANTCAGASVAIDNTCSVAVRFTPTVAGERTARLVFKDNANNSPVQVFELSGQGRDAQAPVVTAPTQTFVTPSAMNVAGNATTVTVTATASDPSGVASMQLEASTDGGRSWGIVKSSTTGVVSTTLTFNFAGTYQFRASATDTLGNASVPVASPAYRVSLSDDNSGVPKFGGSWSAQKSSPATAGAYGNTLHTATAPGAGKTNTATFTFTGTEVALLTSLGPDRGQVSMSVDGGAARVVDLYAPAQQIATVASSISGLAAGPHTVTVNVLATKNPSSSGTRVDVDAFLVKF